MLLGAQNANANNGFIDIGWKDGQEEISTVYQAKKNYLVSYLHNSAGGGLGLQFGDGFAALGGSLNESIWLTVNYRPKTTHWQIDMTIVDNMNYINPSVEFGYNYYIDDKFAIRVYTDLRTGFIGFRRWI